MVSVNVSVLKYPAELLTHRELQLIFMGEASCHERVIKRKRINAGAVAF